MMPVMDEVMLWATGSPAAAMVVKVTVTAALALAGARLARRNRASVRHAILAAAFGVMFLLPVASLIAPPVRIAAPIVVTSLPPLTAIDRVPPIAPSSASALVTHVTPQSSGLSLSALLPALWIAGAMLSLLPMLRGLLEVRSLRRSSHPWLRGQAVVDRLARDAGIQRRVEVLLNGKLPGPMTCGAVHPAIVLAPDAQTWDSQNLNRALVHELEHVRRSDWVSQCLARAVCAVYWFHPLVWVAWRQLVLEAERSCDDAVLERSEATAYADQLVGLARQLSSAARMPAAKSPLLAMAGRADLSARVGALLDSRQRRGRAGAFSVALASAAAAVLVAAMSPLTMVAGPQASSTQIPATPVFDAVSVKLVDPDSGSQHSHEHSDPGRLSMIGSLHRFLIRAYGITDGQLGGEPDWFKTHLYSIDAVTGHRSNSDQMMLMLRSVLAERFQLRLRQEDRDLPVYALEVASGGPKFKELQPGEILADERETGTVFAVNLQSIADLMNTLNHVYGGRLRMDRPVVDRTGLTGKYNIQLRTEVEIQTDDSGIRTAQFPNLFHDMQSELGLKLVPTRVKMPHFVVEHAAAPTAN